MSVRNRIARLEARRDLQPRRDGLLFREVPDIAVALLLVDGELLPYDGQPLANVQIVKTIIGVDPRWI